MTMIATIANHLGAAAMVAHTCPTFSLPKFFLIIWIAHLFVMVSVLLLVGVPSIAALGGLVRFEEVKWSLWELGMAFLPFSTWLAVILCKESGSIAETFIDGAGIGGIAALALILRQMVGTKYNQNATAVGALALACLLASGVGAVGLTDRFL